MQDGSGVRNVTDHGSYDLWPAWSPDGRRLAFDSMREGNLDAGFKIFNRFQQRLEARLESVLASLPETVEGEGLAVSGDTLTTMIAETSYSVSRDETRPALMGILWEVSSDGLTMVATDAHRLDDETPYLFKTTDFGRSWKKITLSPILFSCGTRTFSSEPPK